MGEYIIDEDSPLREKVLLVLQTNPMALNHDLVLAALIYQKFYHVSSECSFNHIIHKVMTKEIPNPETIQRMRQKIMKKGDFTPTKAKQTTTKKAANLITKAFSKTKGSSSGDTKSRVNTPRTASRNSTKK